MMNLNDLGRLATELSPELMTAGPPREWVEEKLNMSVDAFDALVASMQESTLSFFKKNELEAMDLRENIAKTLRTSLVGAMMIGMEIEREYGKKAELGGFLNAT